MADDIPTPEPVIEIAIEPKSKAEQEKLGVALAELAAEDPSFRVSTDQESGQTILKGMSELHLAIKVDILRRTYKVDANIGAPQVAFRERLTRRAEVKYTHKKQTGGTGQFAEVSIVVEPNEPGKGYEFESKIVGGSVPKVYIPGVEKGLNSVLNSGVVAGFPVVDVKVQLVDGKYHDVDSSSLAFEIAARAAFREALIKDKSVLLEPIIKVEVVTPDDFAPVVVNKLNLQRGQIRGQGRRGNATVINAMVPLMNMFGYANNLRSMSLGRATFTVQFDHYTEAPPNIGSDPPPFRPAMGMRDLNAGPNGVAVGLAPRPPKSGCQSRSSRAALVTAPMMRNDGVSSIMVRARRRLRASQTARRFGSSIHSKSILCARPRMRRMIWLPRTPRCPGTAAPYSSAARSRGARRRPRRQTRLPDRRRHWPRYATIRRTCGKTPPTDVRSSPGSRPRTTAGHRVRARGRRKPNSS
jgi:translation elongation factor EF-G